MPVFKQLLWFVGFLFVACLAYIHHGIVRSEFAVLISTYTFAFVAYTWLMQQRQAVNFNFLILLAIVSRIVLIIGVPNLSDDIYRFLWDGHLLHEGLNPYNYKPSELIGQYPQWRILYENMNSQEHYTCYTPINMVINYFATVSNNLALSVVLYRLQLLAIELLCWFPMMSLLKNLNRNRSDAFLYILNPLVILEFTGNLHLEGAVTALMIFSFAAYYKTQQTKSALGLGFAFSFKLLPLIYLGGIFTQRKWSLLFLSATACVVLLGVGFLPFYSELFWPNFSESLTLYFSKFEFNSSVYRLLQSQDLTGLLKFLRPLVMAGLCLWMYYKKTDFIHACLCLMTTYLFLSQSIHPWYVGGIIFFASISKWRFPLVWSYLIFWTYITYQNQPIYEQQAWVIGVEYILLITFIVYEKQVNE